MAGPAANKHSHSEVFVKKKKKSTTTSAIRKRDLMRLVRTHAGCQFNWRLWVCSNWPAKNRGEITGRTAQTKTLEQPNRGHNKQTAPEIRRGKSDALVLSVGENRREERSRFETQLFRSARTRTQTNTSVYLFSLPAALSEA